MILLPDLEHDLEQTIRGFFPDEADKLDLDGSISVLSILGGGC